jgi:hypothetical protein
MNSVVSLCTFPAYWCCVYSCGNLALRGGFAGPVQLKAEEVLHCDNLLGEARNYPHFLHLIFLAPI